MEEIQTVTAQELTEDLANGTVSQWLESLIPKFWSFLWCVILALIVYAIGSFIISFILRVFKKAMRLHDWDEGVQHFVGLVLKYTLYILLFVIIVGLFGITTTSISAAVAAMGVTAGLALQGSLSNFAGGVLILVTHPFRVGDYIIEDSHKNEGTVTSINIIYTTLRTDNGNLVQLPNGSLSNASLTNITASGKRRVNEKIGISYTSDIKRAKEVIMEIVENCPYRLGGESYNVVVSALADSAVMLNLFMFATPAEYWTAKFYILEEVKLRFDKEENIDICFNQLDVHIDGIINN